ncbi:MAG: 2-oxoglutarate dehydrogenase E1 component, partial [Parasphingorhabdus sp.]
MSKSDPEPLSPAALSHLSGGNFPYLESLYQDFLNDPNSVEPNWRETFQSLDQAEPPNNSQSPSVYGSEQWAAGNAKKQSGVLRLINAYRTRGHQVAATDPLGMMEQETLFDITLEANGLGKEDLDTVFDTGSLAAADRLPLKEIIKTCVDIYCGPVGIEYMYITDTPEKRWIQGHVEKRPARPIESADLQKQILERVTAAEGIEKYLHTKYVGQKRFSLEGGESLIPMLSELIQRSGANGAKEMVIGMAHRGRLNVLVNILGKSPAELFDEFEGKTTEEYTDTDSGDVKYHQGFSSDIMTPGGPVHLALSFNPSHLEIINPVVEGSVRARQERRKDTERNQIIPILIHGDAAFAGQGVVLETLNM